MGNQRRKKQRKGNVQISRRDFLKFTGTVAIGAGVLPKLIWLDDAIAVIPASEGYLLVDTKKCQGCLSCMLACSLVHEGTENLSLARIQILQNSFAKFPDDLTMAQCRQCVEPPCVDACPEKALYVDKKLSLDGDVGAKRNEPLPGLKPGVSGLWHTCHDLRPCQTCRERPPLRSERMPFIPRFKSLGFSGMAYK